MRVISMTTVQMPSPYEDSVKCAHLHITYNQCVTYCRFTSPPKKKTEEKSQKYH